MFKLDPSASAGHDDVVRELLGAGANVKKANDKGLTALWVNFSTPLIQTDVGTAAPQDIMQLPSRMWT